MRAHTRRARRLRNCRRDAHDAEQVESLWPSLAEIPVNVDQTLAEPDAPDDEFIYWPN